jgi:sulfane dehydrogenase subunit SoxC
VNANSVSSGRLQKAPESFLTPSGIKEVFAEGKKGRRDFIRNAFAAAAAGAAAPMAMAQSNPVPAEGGDPNILNLPEHATGLGSGRGSGRLWQALASSKRTCSAAKARA